MRNPEVFNRSTLSTSATLIILSLTVILLAALFSLPRPVAISSQPWRIEILASIFVSLVMVFVVNAKNVAEIWASNDRWLSRGSVCIAAFTVWSGLSILWSYSTGAAIHHTLIWLLYLSIVVVSLVLLRSGSGFTIVSVTFVLVTTILGSLCLFDYATVVDFTTAEGLIKGHYSKFAELLVTLLPLVWITSLYIRRRLSKLLTLASGSIGWITVMLSLSRGAYLSGILGFVVLFAGCLMYSKRQYRKKVAILAALWLGLTIGTQLGISMATSIPTTTDYIAAPTAMGRRSSDTRILTWRTAVELIKMHPLMGVGADNFGMSFNTGRASFAQTHASPDSIEIAEDVQLERTHNEPLQVLTELGIVGFLLFAGFFAAITLSLMRQFRHNGRKLSPVLWSAVGGMTAFALSSMFSSFSFRLAQNGIVFFLVLAVAIYELTRLRPKAVTVNSIMTPLFIRFAGLLSAVSMLAYGTTKGIAEYNVYQGEQTPDTEIANQYYRTAFKFDRDNANAYYMLASRYAAENDYAEASTLLREGIDRGIGITLTYSTLAKYQTLAGDRTTAEKTLYEGLDIFPNSVFLHVRTASFLADSGKDLESAIELGVAKRIDRKQANGWFSLITDGSVKTFFKSKTDSEIAAPADLTPDIAVQQYLDKAPEAE